MTPAKYISKFLKVPKPGLHSVSIRELENLYHKKIKGCCRPHIWNSFRQFNYQLASLLQSDYKLWLGGSFFSSFARPSDIDVVVFIDYNLYREKLSKLRQLSKAFASIDLAIVATGDMPEDWRIRQQYRIDSYKDKFSRSKQWYKKKNTNWLQKIIYRMIPPYNSEFSQGIFEVDHEIA